MVKSKKYSFTGHRISIKIEGFNLSKLVSNLMNKKIQMRDVINLSDTEMIFTVKASDFRKVKRIAGMKYRISIIDESGYVPFFRGLRLRKATVSGLALFFIIVYFQSLFLSEVRIYGYERIPEEEIREVLSETGFEEGARKLSKKEELNLVKLHLYNNLDHISWVGIEYNGTIGEVTIVEGNENMGGVISDKPCNIIADKSGYIARILPEEGIRMFNDGDYVKPGDVIISGTVPNNSTTFEDPETLPKERYVHAEGLVEIYVPHRFKFTILPEIMDTESDDGTVSASRKEGEDDYEFVRRVADKEIRKYLKENVSESAKLTNKDLNFTVKESTIEVSVFLETLEKIGIKQEIVNGSKQPV